jgi:transposase
MEKRSMKHYAGLDVSVKETSVCIVDEAGKIIRELKVPSHPDDLVDALRDPAWRLDRIGLEAGPLSQWLFSGMAEAGLPVVCIETRHTKAFLKAQVNKSDRTDARGIAQMMRVNLFRPVHVKTLTSQQHRALLTARKILQDKALAIENDIRGLLRNFGLKVGAIGLGKFNERIRELVEDMPELAEIMEPLLVARQKLREMFAKLHRKLLLIVRDDGVCRRLMTIPGVGPVVSLAFKSTIDVPARFKNSKAVGPSLGLTPVLNQSGESHRVGRVSLCGDDMMRALLYEGFAGHAHPREEMVVVEGLGDERRQTTRTKEGDRRFGSPIGGRHASHLGRRLRVPLDQQSHAGSPLTRNSTVTPSTRRLSFNVSSAARRKDVLRGTMDEVSSLGVLCRQRLGAIRTRVRLSRLIL